VDKPRHFDVGIIGGGPAGATAARWLVGRGYRVAIFHRPSRVAPVNAIWETLSPGALELLRLGHPKFWSRIEPHLVACLAKVLWSCSDSKSSVDRPAALVDRRRLDALLRQSAVDTGATLFSSGRVVSHNGDFWSIAANDAGPIQCRFLVNAAGRHSALRDRRLVHSPRTVALTAQVTGSCIGDAESRIEAAADAWLWAVRSGDANANVTLFVALETAHRWQREDRNVAFLRCLGKTSLCTPQTRLRLSSRIGAVDATIAEQQRVFDDGVAHIGDAALALDPLASQGIQHALLSAQQAGAAINTILASGNVALARKFLTERHSEALRQHLSACVALYQRQDIFHTPFWQERSDTIIRAVPTLFVNPSFSASQLLEARLALSPRVRWELFPVVVGDFIEARPALCHPHLSRAVAYLEDQPLGDLLADLPERFTGASLLRRWIEKGLSAAAASRALVFLVRHQVLAARGGDLCEHGRNGENTNRLFTPRRGQLGRL
jgi:flavin-dependent dehydrogenase